MKFRKNLFDTQPIRTSFYFSVCNVCVYLFIYLFVCAADHVDVVCMHARTFMLIRIRSYESCMWHRSTAKHIQSIGYIPYDFAVFFLLERVFVSSSSPLPPFHPHRTLLKIIALQSNQLLRSCRTVCVFFLNSFLAWCNKTGKNLIWSDFLRRKAINHSNLFYLNWFSSNFVWSADEMLP